jgi:cell division protease FtsH
VKRFVRSPWLWIVVAVLGVLFALQYLAPSGGYDEIKYSTMNSYITNGHVQDITLIDGDQQIKATLKDGVRPAGADVTAHWLDGTENGLVKEIEAQVKAGTIPADGYDNKISKPSLLASILTTLLPFVLIVLLFLFLMNQVQGGGGRGVMQFAKSKAKLISKDMPKTTFGDVAGCEEAVEELGEIKEFLQEPAKFQGPARPCSRARSRVRRASPSTRSPGPTSSRCSWASVRAACATCSSRPRRTLRRSSSSTRSTPWVATAAPEWVVATTSASRL